MERESDRWDVGVHRDGNRAARRAVDRDAARPQSLAAAGSRDGIPRAVIRSLCVFCGSNSGNDPIYANVAREFGALLAKENVTLIYGGGHVGLMGIAADAALAGGGKAVGVIPRMLWDREVGHRNLTKLHIVETMHERKAMMALLSDAFVALPGGLGTLEEIFEVWTWAQLGIHR